MMLPLPYPTCMLAPLLDTLAARYDEEELRTLCFELGVDYESLPAQGKAGKARALILERNRRGRAGDILARGRAKRPDIDWDAVEPRLQSLGACAGRPGCWAAVLLCLALAAGLALAAPAATRWLRRAEATPTPPAAFTLVVEVLSEDASRAAPQAAVTLELLGGVQERREADADGKAQFLIDGARQGQMANIVVELAGRRVAERAVRLDRAALPERIPVSP
jgi:hypothetical protein